LISTFVVCEKNIYRTHAHIVDSCILRSMQDDDDDDDDDDDRLFFLAAYTDRDEPIRVWIETFDMDTVTLHHDDMQKWFFADAINC